MFALPCVGTLGPCLASAAAGCACSCCTAVTSQAMRSSARAAWSILFSFSLLVAWIARDFGASLLKQLPCEPIWVLQAAVDVSRPPSGSGGGAPPLPPTAHRPTPHPLRAAAAVLCACRGRASLHRWRPPTRLLVWAAGCVPHQHGQLGAPPLEPPLELARTELPRTWLACCRHFLPLRCVLNLFRPSPLTVPLAPLPPPLLPCCTQVLFGGLAVVMLGVRRRGEPRAALLHHGHWLLKAGLWALCNAAPFLLPNGAVDAYAWLARFGSPLFLLVQMVILLDVTQVKGGRGGGCLPASSPRCSECAAFPLNAAVSPADARLCRRRRCRLGLPHPLHPWFRAGTTRGWRQARRTRATSTRCWR